MAYLTDLSEIPDSSYAMLKGLSVLVLGVLRYKPHPTHLTYEKALQGIGGETAAGANILHAHQP